MKPVDNTYLKIQRNMGVSVQPPPPSVRVFNLTFLLFGLKCNYWCIDMCCQYFSRRNNYIKYCFKSCTTTRLKVLIKTKVCIKPHALLSLSDLLYALKND